MDEYRVGGGDSSLRFHPKWSKFGKIVHLGPNTLRNILWALKNVKNAIL